MADGNYARLSAGGLLLAALVEPPKRGRGRPKGAKDTPPRQAYTPRRQWNAVCEAPACGAVYAQVFERQRYCTPKCRNKESNRADQGRRRNSDPRACRWCGVEYVPEYGSLRTHYCTTACRDKASNARRSGSTHRRRAKNHGCELSYVNKSVVFERDGWKCQLCGCDTPVEARGKGLPNSPELDHAVPLSMGGAHTYENTQCMCRACNGWKAARTMDEARSALQALSDQGGRGL